MNINAYVELEQLDGNLTFGLVDEGPVANRRKKNQFCGKEKSIKWTKPLEH